MNKKSTNNSRTTIISIVILDLILMSLFLFFSDLILKDFQSSSNISTVIISSFAIAIPGTLLILIIFQFKKLLHNRYSPGNSFKKNIVSYFIITMFLVIIPQAFISINFINTSKNNWLSKQVTEAVSIGFNMALDFENRTKKEIIRLSKSSIFYDVIKDIYSGKTITIDDLSDINSLIITFEIYSLYGEPIKQLGSSKNYIETVDFNKSDFFYPKVKIEKREIIYYQYTKNLKGINRIIILGLIQPENFTQNGTLLTSVKKSLALATPKNSDITFGMFIYYLLFSIPMFLLAILGSFIFSDEVVKPLKDLEEATRSVALGNYSYRILSKRKNEFSIIINSFNNMIKEVEKSRNKLKHTEQISTWQDIATRLAHEIRNPLTPIKLSAQRVLLKDGDNPNSKYMRTIINEVTRMEKLLNEFRDFARFPQLKIENVSIKSMIIEAIAIYTNNYPDISFDITAIDDMEVDIDKSQMIQVISNLTVNGIHAMENRGVISYSGESVQKKGVTYCRICIKDSGHGIANDVIPNIFKPYFTTKYNGSGLGLAIVNKIILDHKGKIWIESAVDIGTTFYFEFPKDAI